MNNNSNHNTVWILGLIVVLVLGVLIGTNLKKPAGVAINTADQQGAVTRSNVTRSADYSSAINQYDNLVKNGSIISLRQYISNLGLVTQNEQNKQTICYEGGIGNWHQANCSCSWLGTSGDGVWYNMGSYNTSTRICVDF